MAVKWVRNMKREHSEELGPRLTGVKEELDKSSTRLRYSKITSHLMITATSISA